MLITFGGKETVVLIYPEGGDGKDGLELDPVCKEAVAAVEIAELGI